MTVGRLAARVLLFPWGLHSLLAWPARRWRGPGPGARWAVGVAAEIVVGAVVVLPLSLFLAMEGVIALNRLVVGENTDYRIPTDVETGIVALPPLPGSEPDRDPAEPALPNPLRPEDFLDPSVRRALALRYAPVIVQEFAYRPEWDVPVAVDFDGNDDPRDNPASAARDRGLEAVVYGELTGVTTDALYLTYTLYRIRDYDHPVRQWISRWTHHDSDNEGFHVRVDRETGVPESVETWFHNRFLLCNRTGVSTGSEPVRGRLHLEGSRPVILSQSHGHGVRCAQSVDLARREGIKLLRPTPDGPGDQPTLNRSFESDLRYRLAGFDAWYAAAAHPDREPLFADTLHLGPGLVVGRHIAGLDRNDVGPWSRPKPMWAWDDGWDDLPVAIWHFLPSVSFAMREGGQRSHVYLFNAPLSAIFGLDADEFSRRVDLEVDRRDGEKWETLEERGQVGRRDYWTAAGALLARYATRVFMALG